MFKNIIDKIKKIIGIKSLVTNQFSKTFLIISQNNNIYYYYVPYEIQEKVNCFNWIVKDNKAYNILMKKELYQYIRDNIHRLDMQYIQYTNCFNLFMEEVKHDND